MKKSLPNILAALPYLSNRTPEMAFTGESDAAFGAVAGLGESSIYVGHYSGNSEWERHPGGDELVMALEGTTTLVLLNGAEEEKARLTKLELVVVPAGVWHRFEGSQQLKVLTITPPSTDHRLDHPVA